MTIFLVLLLTITAFRSRNCFGSISAPWQTPSGKACRRPSVARSWKFPWHHATHADKLPLVRYDRRLRFSLREQESFALSFNLACRHEARTCCSVMSKPDSSQALQQVSQQFSFSSARVKQKAANAHGATFIATHPEHLKNKNISIKN